MLDAQRTVLRILTGRKKECCHQLVVFAIAKILEKGGGLGKIMVSFVFNIFWKSLYVIKWPTLAFKMTPLFRWFIIYLISQHLDYFYFFLLKLYTLFLISEHNHDSLGEEFLM